MVTTITRLDERLGEPVLGWAAIHASSLRRAVLNLVPNALDAMLQGGMLTLAGQRDDNCPIPYCHFESFLPQRRGLLRAPRGKATWQVLAHVPRARSDLGQRRMVTSLTSDSRVERPACSPDQSEAAQ